MIFLTLALTSMRVLQLIRSLSFGGAENHVVQLSAGLRDRGVDITVVCPKNSWVSERCRELEISFAPIAMRGLFDVVSYVNLHRVIAQTKAEIVHAHQTRPSLYAGIACMGARAIPISTAHSTNATKHMSRARHIIAVSEAVKNNLIAHGFSKDRITRIYHGIQETPQMSREALRRELNIPHDVFAVVCAGRFAYDKGQDLLLQTVDQLPAAVHLYLMGNTQTSFGRELAQTYGQHPRVTFLGQRNDVPRLLPAFDLYCAPSRREALSLSILEACAARLPTVGSRLGGIPEVVVEEETGLLVPPENVKALVGAITALFSNQKKTQAMGAFARARFEKLFTYSRMIEETERVYRRVLGTIL